MVEGGNGGTADVSGGNLHVVNETPMQAAIKRGDAFAWCWSYNSAANDCAMAVMNDATDMTLVIDRIIISSDAAGEWIVHT
jgi:hypothetical protein